MKFAEIIDRLNNGEILAREAWAGGTCIVKQIPQTVPAEVVPRMTSLPEAAKKMLTGTVSYHDQVLIMRVGNWGAEAYATSYLPSWEDIFADDWRTIDIEV